MELYLEFLFTAILSVLLAFLLGKLFTDEDGADRDRDRQLTEIAGDGKGDDPLRSGLFNASVSSYHKEPGPDEVRSDEISMKESSDEVKIERSGDDLGKQRGDEVDREVLVISELDDARVYEDPRTVEKVESLDVLPQVLSAEVDELEIRFEASSVEDNTANVMSERVDSEFLEDVAGLGEEEAALKEGCEESSSLTDEKTQSLLLGEDDEWEGIERTELQKRFHEAAAYVGGEGGEFALSKLSDDQQLQLYGLHKVATEGPCYDSQPMALKVSARAKWNAWQRLGNLNPDAAMEQYMSLLSEYFPEWTGQKTKEPSEVIETESSRACPPKFYSDIHSQLSSETEREHKLHSCITEPIESANAKHTG